MNIIYHIDSPGSQEQSESWEVLLKERIKEAVAAALAPEQQKYEALQLLGGVRFKEKIKISRIPKLNVLEFGIRVSVRSEHSHAFTHTHVYLQHFIALI